jgi:ABC-type Fe3+ transport system substrate-binding protein
MENGLTRRDLIRTTGLAGAGLAAACAPGASAPQATTSSGKTGWEADWDTLVAAAKKEGQVVVQFPLGASFRLVMDEFAKAFPGVEPEMQQFPDSNAFVPKITQEWKAGIYTFDMACITVTPMLQDFKPAGFLEPLKPNIIRPDVMDDKAWFGGFDSRFADLTKSHVFRHEIQITKSVYLNTDLVKPDEIKALDDLLDPRWKGKIVTSDVTQGFIYTPSTIIREQKGEAWLKRLFVDQEPQIIRDRRQAIEALVRGKGAIGFGLHPIVMRDFIKESGAKNVLNPDIPGAGFEAGDTVVLYSNAPHPNAAKLFLNWLLSKEGQTVWSSNVKNNSARTDVPIVDEGTAPGKVSYEKPTQEDWLPKTGATQEFLKKLVV